MPIKDNKVLAFFTVANRHQRFLDLGGLVIQGAHISTFQENFRLQLPKIRSDRTKCTNKLLACLRTRRRLDRPLRIGIWIGNADCSAAVERLHLDLE